MSAVEAWTDYFDNALPEAGYAPDTDHGMYFEFYPGDNLSSCQLWTPVKKV
jgi:AraC family transcriptional regulator